MPDVHEGLWKQGLHACASSLRNQGAAGVISENLTAGSGGILLFSASHAQRHRHSCGEWGPRKLCIYHLSFFFCFGSLFLSVRASALDRTTNKTYILYYGLGQVDNNCMSRSGEIRGGTRLGARQRDGTGRASAARKQDVAADEPCSPMEALVGGCPVRMSFCHLRFKVHERVPDEVDGCLERRTRRS